MELPFFKNSIGITENLIMNKYPEYYIMLNNYIICNDSKISEKIWLYQNKMNNRPKCLNCDNDVKFIKFSKGYQKYCSKKCSSIHTHKNIETKNKRVSKMISCNYDKEIRQLMTDKSKNTKSEFSKTKKENINLKRIETVKNLWGVDNISKNNEININKSSRIKSSLSNTLKKKTINRILESGFTYNDIISEDFNITCNKCLNSFQISKSLFNQRKRFGIDICLICNPKNNESNFEMSVLSFISDNTKDYISKYRDYKKYEIDIYLPNLKIGFECNGLWWHSEYYKENNYHINKNNFFKENGIQIINIWEDDWKFKKDIVKSRIINIINKSKNNKIFARKCIIKEINNQEYNDFVTKNHIQSYAPSKIRIGLFYNNELISIMSFSKLRKNLGFNDISGNYELIRFCSKLNTNVIGSASRLLKFFIKKYNPEKIISYANKDWSIGKLYTEIGFKKVKETVPNYFYFNKDECIRKNRFSFRKDKLVSDGYDKNKTEHKIMIEKGYYRIYDSGSILFELDLVN